LLNPSIKIGTSVKLNSTVNLYRYALDIQSVNSNLNLQKSIHENGDGLYYVVVATHFGDTRGNSWFTELTCLAIDASVPLDQGFLKDSIADRSHRTPLNRF
jgi:hypothetical protein